MKRSHDLKKSKYIEQQIAFALKQVELGRMPSVQMEIRANRPQQMEDLRGRYKN